MAPIVTNPVGEVHEALSDRAWYFKDGDIEDLIRVLEQCLVTSRDECCPDEALASRHSWRARAETYLEFLDGDLGVTLRPAV